MNKKGDIPITILVVGTVVICVIALVALHISENKESKELSFFSGLSMLFHIQDQMRFYSTEDVSFVKRLYMGGDDYYPIVKDIAKINEGGTNYLILKKEAKKGGILGIGAKEKLIFEFKVPI